MKINTVDDLLCKESGLARLCSHRWFRLLSEPKKRGHSNEQKINKLWQEVQSQFEKYFPGVDGHREEVTRSKVKILKCSVESLEKQAVGCLKTAAALRFGSDNVLSETEKYVLRVLEQQLHGITQGALDRAIMYEIRNGQISSQEIEKSCKVPTREELQKYLEKG
jgi:hypothetical protein